MNFLAKNSLPEPVGPDIKILLSVDASLVISFFFIFKFRDYFYQ